MSNEMAYTEKCIFTIMMILWIVNYSVTTCPEICKSKKNRTLCLPSLYNMYLKESGSRQEVQICCDEDLSDSQNSIHKKFVSTYTEVAVKVESSCILSEMDFNFPTLSTYSLSMTHNNISKLRINIKLTKVREINLSFNKLEYINRDLFGGFVNLRQLILRKNLINKIFEDSFIGLSKLETLDLSENSLTILTNVFLPLKNLQHLNISRNNLEFLNESYFNNWVLQHLDVSHNNLRKISPGALQHLPNLARLLLTDNPHLGITQLDTQLFVGTGRRLQQIDASRTGLYQVPEAFTHSVRFLSLVGNNVTSIRCGDLDSYPLLQSLDFSDNKISLIEDDSLGRLEMLLFLNINKNSLNIVPRTLPDELKYLSFNDNSIRNLSIPDFKNLPNLKILLIKNNLISYIEDHVFDDLLSLEMLDLSSNPIQMLSFSTFDGPLSLRDLRLCYLNVSMPETDGSFPMSSPESVQMLHLQSSPGLARQLLADSAALAAFSHLQYLDLRMNNISELRNDLLFYLVQLKTLRLHGNQLNCNNETWLTEWMNKTNNNSSNETCYYSTPEAKLEINKYNCTFPETFTISDSLPPVNLYSTEMINKLLRYYGYLYNKTEKSPLKSSDVKKSKTIIKSENDNNSLILEKNTTKNINIRDTKIENDHREIKLSTNEISLHDYVNKSYNNQLKEFEVRSNKRDNPRYSDMKPYLPFIRSKLNDHSTEDSTEIKDKVTLKAINTTASTEKEIDKAKTESQDIQHPVTRKDYTVKPDNLEYSPYQSINTKYAEYIVTIGITCLIVVALTLWASFRLRFKRRQLQELSSNIEDQIEVSNISGGVLW